MKELVLKKSCPCVFYMCCKCVLRVAKLGKESIVNLVLQHLAKNIVYFMFAWGNNLMCALVNSSLSMWRCLYMITNFNEM